MACILAENCSRPGQSSISSFPDCGSIILAGLPSQRPIPAIPLAGGHTWFLPDTTSGRVSIRNSRRLERWGGSGHDPAFSRPGLLHGIRSGNDRTMKASPSNSNTSSLGTTKPECHSPKWIQPATSLQKKALLKFRDGSSWIGMKASMTAIKTLQT